MTRITMHWDWYTTSRDLPKVRQVHGWQEMSAAGA